MDTPNLKTTHQITHMVVLTDDQNNTIGEFKIIAQCNQKNGCFGTGATHSMSISLDDSFQKKGLSKKMIKHMVDNIRNVTPEQLFFIDTDASEGFWDHIGMKINPHYNYTENTKAEGEGYEKMITFQELKKFATSQSHGSRYTKSKKQKHVHGGHSLKHRRQKSK